MNFFWRIYLPLRSFIFFLGAFPSSIIFPGAVIFSPIIFILLYILPESMEESIWNAVDFFIREIIFLGYDIELTAIQIIAIICLPAIFGILILIAENITGLYLAAEKAEEDRRKKTTKT